MTVQAAFAGADLEREKRLAAQIEDAILDGEPEYLDANGHRFLGIYTKSEDKPRGGVIILHGRGFHPDWANVVQPLRVRLPELGWSTLSLQMPVLKKEATYYDYIPLFPEAAPRIEAGIDFLRARGLESIVVLAHSCGVHMSMYWFDKYGDERIAGYVGIGMGATDYGQPMEKPLPLDRMRVPVLDIYGSKDYPAVMNAVPRRAAAAAKAGNRKSRQVMIEGADHYFSGMDDPLVGVVLEWLDTL